MTYRSPGSTGIQLTTPTVAVDPALAAADPERMAKVAQAFASAAHQVEGAGQASAQASARLSQSWSGRGSEGFDAASSKANSRARADAEAMTAASRALMMLSAQIAAAKELAKRAGAIAEATNQAAASLQSSYAASSEQSVRALPADATYEQVLVAGAPTAGQLAQADHISSDAANADQMMVTANSMSRQAWDQASAAFDAVTASFPRLKAATAAAMTKPTHGPAKVSPDQVRVVTEPGGRRVYSFDGGLAIPIDMPGAQRIVEQIKSYMPKFMAGDHAGLQVPDGLSAQGLWYLAASYLVTTTMHDVPDALRNVFFTARFSGITMKQLAGAAMFGTTGAVMPAKPPAIPNSDFLDTGDGPPPPPSTVDEEAIGDQVNQADTALEADGQRATLFNVGNGAAGKRLPMTWDSINAVCEKYGIDVSDLDITIDKARQGDAAGVTREDESVILTRDAFASEEELARTLIHEQFHVEQQLRAGMPYPKTAAAADPYEEAATAYEKHWWSTHPLNNP